MGWEESCTLRAVCSAWCTVFDAWVTVLKPVDWWWESSMEDKLPWFERVTCLDLSKTSMALAGMAYFGRLLSTRLPKLVNLSLGYDGQLSMGAAKALGFMTHLTTLAIVDFQYLEVDYLGGHIEADGSEISQAAVEELSKFTRLANLTLGGFNMSIKDVRVLSRMSGLTSLCLTSCFDVTNLVLKELARMSALTHFSLGPCNNLSDSGMTVMRKFSGLKSLELSNGDKITSAGLRHLACLTRLTSIQLRNFDSCKSSDVLRTLATLTTLNTLKLLDCFGLVTVKAVAELVSLPALTCIHLRDVLLTNQGLQVLSTLPSLAFLELKWLKVTKAGVEEFRLAAPNVDVKLILGRNPDSPTDSDEDPDPDGYDSEDMNNLHW